MEPEHRARCEQAIMRLGINKAQAVNVFEAGYLTPRFLREATNEELLAIDGIGERAVRRIRERLSRRG